MGAPTPERDDHLVARPPLDRPVEVRPSAIAGRGVFATRAVAAGEVLDVAPVVLIPADQRADLDATDLRAHYWDWDGGAAFAFGPITFTNHGSPANARWERDDPGLAMVLIATRDLAAGDEVLADYLTDGGPDDTLWFDPVPPPAS